MLDAPRSVLVLSLVAAAGCGGTSAGAADAGLTGSADAGCRTQWKKVRMVNDAMTTVQVKDGALSLAVPISFESWAVTATSTEMLTGDFDVTIQVDQFDHQDPFTHLAIGVSEGSDDGTAFFGGTEAGAGWRGVGWPHPASVTAETRASFRFTRTDDVLTTHAAAGSGQPLVTRTIHFMTDPVPVRIMLRSSQGIPRAAATISEVIVKGGGGALVSDTFDCNSVQ